MAHWFKAIGRDSLKNALFLTQFFCCVHLLKAHVVDLHQVVGPSMLPTFSVTGDVVLVDRLSTRFRKIKQGDIVVALSPENPRRSVCKRVIGLEGDQVVVLPNEGIGNGLHVSVPKGHVWLQGDNVQKSKDSRHYGPVPRALLQGRVCFRVWPLKGWTRY